MPQLKPIKVVLCGALLAGVVACGRGGQQGGGGGGISQDGILEYIPADTPYVLAMPEAMPDDVLAKFEENTEIFVDAYEDLLESMVEDLDADDPDREDAELLSQLLEELGELMTREGREEAGMGRTPQFAVYGMDWLPVMRFSLEDPAAMEAKLAELEEIVGEEMPRGEIDGNSYRVLGDESDGFLIIGIFDDQFVVTFVPGEFSDELVSQVLGLTQPEESLADSGGLSTLANTYDFTSYFLGYVDIPQMVTPILTGDTGINGELLTLLEYDESEVPPACRDELLEVAAAVPQIAFGYTEVSTSEIGFNTILALDADWVSELPSLSAPVPGLGTDLGGIFSLGFGLDLQAAKSFVEARVDYLIANPYECEVFEELQEGLGEVQAALNQPIPPFVYDFKGAVAIIDNIDGIDFEGDSVLEELDMRLLVANDNAQELLGMGALMVPEIAALNLQPGGEPVEVELPLGADEVPGPIFAALSETALALSVGNGSASQLSALLSATGGDPAPFMSLGLDGRRYFEFVSQTLETQMENEPDEDMARQVQQSMEVMSRMGNLIERMTSEIRFTERGIEFPSSYQLAD